MGSGPVGSERPAQVKLKLVGRLPMPCRSTAARSGSPAAFLVALRYSGRDARSERPGVLSFCLTETSRP